MIESLRQELHDHIATEALRDAAVDGKLDLLIEALNMYRIPPQDHYDKHARLDRLLDIYEETTSTFIRWVIRMVVVGALVLAALGIKWGVQ